MSGNSNQFSYPAESPKEDSLLSESPAPRSLLPLLLLLTLPAAVRSQDFTFTTNNGAITITAYTGSGGAVTIPSSSYSAKPACPSANKNPCPRQR